MTSADAPLVCDAVPITRKSLGDKHYYGGAAAFNLEVLQLAKDGAELRHKGKGRRYDIPAEALVVSLPDTFFHTWSKHGLGP